MTGRQHILILDNRDSFVYNIARYFEELGARADVQSSHAMTLSDIRSLAPDALVISPGPCTPAQAGISVQSVRAFAGTLPILGICLGHQAIAEAFGWHIGRSATPYYGEAHPIDHEQDALFEGLPNPLSAGLYHSLVAYPGPETPLKVTARSVGGEVMAIEHDHLPVFGVQFHPESVLTECGHTLFANFLKYVPEPVAG